MEKTHMTETLSAKSMIHQPGFKQLLKKETFVLFFVVSLTLSADRKFIFISSGQVSAAYAIDQPPTYTFS
jgi:hypothetical protein